MPGRSGVAGRSNKYNILGLEQHDTINRLYIKELAQARFYILHIA